jgi:adenylate kinase family enzyme
MSKVINLFGAPCAGKSTHRAKIFAEMKIRGYSVEEVTEYAKDAVWEQRDFLLDDQLYILAKQNRRLKRLLGKVDYIITDSPLLLSIIYANKQISYNKSLKNLTLEIFNHYNNINFFLNRTHSYQSSGRVHTDIESKQISNEIQDLLKLNNVNYISYNTNEFNFRDLEQYL